MSLTISIRWHFAYLQEKYTLDAVRSRLSKIKAHSFAVLDAQPRHTEGGVFVAFEFIARDEEAALRTIDAELEREAETRGGLPVWRVGSRFRIVKGKPWMEDLRRYPSNFLRVSFDGPDIGEEQLYELMRLYGHIHDIREPFPAPAGSLRWASVVFDRTAAAAVARNAIHGLEVWAPGAAVPTTLRISYGQQLDGHKIREWIFKHPRIAFPIVIFVVTGIAYTIFDSIRSIMVQAKIEKWFDVREYRLYQWIRAKSAELRIFPPRPETASSAEEVWKERKQAEAALQTYLTEWPSTIAFVHGPQGSGKSHLLDNALKDSRRKTLVIDCRPLQNATSDTQLMTVLASQTGFRPFFSSLGFIHHLIDLASVGVIGQKANVSSTLPEQVREMLAVVRRSLKHVKSSHQRYAIRLMRQRARQEESEKIHAVRSERIQRGTWHDGRLDCVAGNGVMAELGLGDERMGDDDDIVLASVKQEEGCEAVDTRRKQKSKAEIAAVDGLPIVVLRNFDARGSNRGEVYDVLAEWAADLVENQLAHVIVISDNRENTKRLTKALPSKPLNTIPLHDADAASALAFVKRKLEDADIDLEYTREQVASVERLGGRATDLENLIHKVRNGATVEDAVEDIIYREVNEVRKKAFGDDAEDAKNLPWGREQAWALFKLLSKNSEIPYHEVLLEFPFKGDEAPLRSMEHAELISIGTHNGRPSTIRPGKPVFRAVFERLVNDSIFQATQDIAFNEKVIAAAESTVKACEQELLSLKDIGGGWGGNAASSTRSRYLLSKMHASAMKIEALEGRNSELKKVLAKGG
ncbi:RNA12 protein-domain-containing protein [Mycena albidolilacea]|uniref:Mitochondrial escape protein 2 n=1 Tax=Mycena albidolilacea TaxID=1033008 RepID=A0AAD7F504_9AGAR|nr:RNA12 protein-domain-containing protein [Mycena albidolilacea]